MKSKKTLIGICAALVVAVIATVWISRHQGLQKPSDFPKAKGLPKIEETSAQPAPTLSPSNQKQARLPDSSPSSPMSPSLSHSPAPVDGEASTASSGDDSAYQPLKELVFTELAPKWDEALEYPPLHEVQLSDSQRESVDHSPVPVLLPDEQKLVNAALISTGSNWYAASMNENDLTVMVSGNSKVALVPDSPAAEPPDLNNPKSSLTRVEGIVEVSFKAFGIYYDVTVECYDHENDPRCAADAYILELVDKLKMASAKAPS